MLFNSWSFFIFFPLSTFGYFLLAERWRWMYLLAISCLFYMAFIPVYLLLMGVVIVVDYVAARAMERMDARHRRAIFISSLILTGLPLLLFKYLGFFQESIHAIAIVIGWNSPVALLSWIVPLGLSFHTFQALSYLIEVHAGRMRAERHLGMYALYVLFYPQLVAGPIERPQHLLPQFREAHPFEYRRVTDGLKVMAWGFFHKIVIADRIAPLVNHAYAMPATAPWPALCIATVLFAVQIYCDFAGYSLIALGAAQVLGYRLTSNFNHPYASSSIIEFWRRWHISLSSWFRDYVYIPLGGNRSGRWRQAANIALTFLLSGLWHGANWTYVVWGGLHGLLLIVSRAGERVRYQIAAGLGLHRWPRLRQTIQVLSVFVLVDLTWVFFRAATVGDAWTILQRIASGFVFDWSPVVFARAASLLGSTTENTIYLAIGIAILFFAWTIERREPLTVWISQRSTRARWTGYAVLLICLIHLGQWGAPANFIYFQF
jgi:alginate O-acetyltransferase complex protein AlgI